MSRQSVFDNFVEATIPKNNAYSLSHKKYINIIFSIRTYTIYDVSVVKAMCEPQFSDESFLLLSRKTLRVCIIGRRPLKNCVIQDKFTTPQQCCVV